jgi:ATP-binding cassette, subfamily F, member 3
MRQALTVALQEFEGALVLVSHDRHLLRATADELLLVDAGRVTEFDGDLDDYPKWLTRRRRVSGAGDEKPVTENNKREQRRRQAQKRAALKPLANKVRSLESRLDTLHRDETRLEQLLADNDLYEAQGKTRLAELLREQGEIRRRIGLAEGMLMEAMEALEAAERDTADA